MESAKLAPSVQVSGGNPAGFPDYRPINKLPPDEFRALLRKAVKPALYQVWVEDRTRGFIPVFPRVPLAAADSLVAAIRGQIALGRERRWANPSVLPVGGSNG